jgi:hypothetical protein
LFWRQAELNEVFGDLQPAFCSALPKPLCPALFKPFCLAFGFSLGSAFP